MQIDNYTRSGVLAGSERLARDQAIKKHVLDVGNVRHGCDAGYNCHGMVFASRRAWVDRPETVDQILHEDGYRPVELKDVMAGDVVVYREVNGDAAHSGIVVEAPIQRGVYVQVMKVWSKWGSGNEVIHPVTACPYPTERIQYYRPRGTEHDDSI